MCAKERKGQDDVKQGRDEWRSPDDVWPQKHEFAEKEPPYPVARKLEPTGEEPTPDFNQEKVGRPHQGYSAPIVAGHGSSICSRESESKAARNDSSTEGSRPFA